DDGAAERSAMAIERSIERAAYQGVRMEHQIGPDETVRVREAVGKSGRARIEQKTRRADPVRREHDRTRLLLHQSPVAIVVERAVGETVGADRDLADTSTRRERRAGGDRLGPVGAVGPRLGAGGTPELAGAAVDAGPPAVVVRGQDRAVRRPPVPAEPIEAARDRGAERVERDRRRLT